MIDEIAEIAKRWLEEGEVDAFIGFRRRIDGSVVPTRITKGEEAASLVFGDGCTHNLLSYVDLRGDERVGLLLKGCDGRALVQLMVEGEIDRDRVKVLGVVCPGMNEGGELETKCVACRVNTPPVYDELTTPDGAEPWDRTPELPELAEVEAMSPEDRSDFFRKQFDKCIRCYACRDVCPLCYCEECVSEKSSPQWVEVSVKPSSNAYWNLIRAYHLAGRCVECGECDRACPVGIPLRLLNQRMAREAERLFGYVPGTDPEATPVLLEFKEDEEHVLCPGGQS
jgi:formate dehydrogenase (coenzyme F420) beta subunit